MDQFEMCRYRGLFSHSQNGSNHFLSELISVYNQVEPNNVHSIRASFNGNEPSASFGEQLPPITISQFDRFDNVVPIQEIPPVTIVATRGASVCISFFANFLIIGLLFNSIFLQIVITKVEPGEDGETAIIEARLKKFSEQPQSVRDVNDLSITVNWNRKLVKIDTALQIVPGKFFF
jgi:hypothetical protein